VREKLFIALLQDTQTSKSEKSKKPVILQK